MPAAVEVMEIPNSQSAMDASNADKKRNKLGYHRTSVACVHCRRRKIRCLVAPDDSQGRCENCIRLRKECQFFPVDQQPPVEKKSRPTSRLETQPPTDSASITSSPTNIKFDSPETFYPYQQIPLNASSGQDIAAFNPAVYAGHPMSGFAPDRPMGGEFSAHPAMETGVPWDEFTTISDPQMLATMAANKNQMMNLSPNVWAPASVPAGLSPGSPMSGASPMSGQAQPMNTPTYTMQADGTVWQVPPPPQPSRAMSYPGQEMNPSYHNQFQPQMPPDLKRRMTTPAQSLSSGAHSSPGSAPDMQNPPGSVQYQPQPGMEYAQWPMNAMQPGMGVVPYPMYAGDVQQQPYSNPPMGHPRSGP
ncbi:hypothetical protein N7520_003008 [Penicillium odoratum]|uniref:uncharacterized protein n=1 Tax=Penicillium odoratum TaxID=1167516 RepID=UPI002547C4C3|nr:uncharacterized protein N7520_003008 [Penicillium odoratum]KAJ5772479.1 hypothetical protein N7520_003008 [Penicillium odoratum]